MWIHYYLNSPDTFFYEIILLGRHRNCKLERFVTIVGPYSPVLRYRIMLLSFNKSFILRGGHENVALRKHMISNQRCVLHKMPTQNVYVCRNPRTSLLKTSKITDSIKYFNPLLVITGSEIACVRVVVKCGVL